jgi:hypothetical protein
MSGTDGGPSSGERVCEYKGCEDPATSFIEIVEWSRKNYFCDHHRGEMMLFFTEAEGTA